MKYRIKALPDSSYLRQVAAIEYRDSILTGRVDCEADVTVTKAFLAYHGDDYYHRPYLCLTGRATTLRGAFPCDISEVLLDGDGIGVAFIYEFSGDELASMCRKGLFTRDFKCPSTFENEWIGLPIPDCRYTIIPGDGGTPPVVFAGIDRRYSLALDSSCGYVAGEYFEYTAGVMEDLGMDESAQAAEKTDLVRTDAESAEMIRDEESKNGPAMTLERSGQLSDLTDEVIEKDPQMKAAYEEMQARVRAGMSRKAERRATLTDSDKELLERDEAGGEKRGGDDLLRYLIENRPNVAPDDII